MKIAWVVMGLSVAWASSCGGGAGGAGGSCGKVEPCGGPVLGTWKAAPACVGSGFTATFQNSCPGVTVSGVTATQSGTYTFNADLTYSIAVTGQATFDVTFPASCNSSGSCAGLAAQLQTADPGATATCTGTGACVCHFVVPATDDEQGTYTTGGTTVTLLNSADGSTTPQSYCVQGNTLHILDVDTTMNMGPMGQATIVDDATYTKE
ncbi:MAG TPA: hypothetical protein VHO67_11645 [Polyangia bacterium]|nr:hypothetical protein [Polyangia bacterium]